MQDVPTNGFYFDEVNHLYYLDGKLITGVTTILDVIAKNLQGYVSRNVARDAIILSYRNRQTKPLREALLKCSFNVTSEEGKKLAKEFPLFGDILKAPTKRKDDAADKGTQFHDWVEEYFNILIKDKTYIPTEEAMGDLKHMALPLVEWIQENDVSILASEKKVYSRKYWYAGTLDFICAIGHHKFLGDLKTSARIYPTNFWQTAAYQNALEEMEPVSGISGNLIVNITKEGKRRVETSYDYQEHRQAFMGALAIYREQKRNARKI